jgi:hypothetical protein
MVELNSMTSSPPLLLQEKGDQLHKPQLRIISEQ